MPEEATTHAEAGTYWEKYEAADAERERLAHSMLRVGRLTLFSIYAFAVVAVLVLVFVESQVLIWIVLSYALLVVASNWLIGQIVARLDARYAIHARTMRGAVAEIMDRDPAFMEGCFALWLRPFHTDLSIGFINEKRWPSWVNTLLPTQLWSNTVLYDINECIDFSVGEWLPVVALGAPVYRPDDQLICYLPATDDTWQARITELIGYAEAIVIMPDATDGTLLEIQELRRLGRLASTVFLMPGENRFAVEDTSQGGKPPFDPKNEWELARAQLREHQVRLPAYEPRGCFFTVTEAGDRIVTKDVWHMSGEAATLEQMRDNFEILLQVLSEVLEDGPVWRRV